MQKATKNTIFKQNTDRQNQNVAGTPYFSHTKGEMKKFSTEPRLQELRIAPNDNANSFPLK